MGTPVLVTILRRLCDLQSFAESRIQIAIAEYLLQGRERRFAGAVPGRNVVNFSGLIEAPPHFLDVRVFRGDQVQSTDDQMNVVINCIGRFYDSLDTRVRAPHDQD